MMYENTESNGKNETPPSNITNNEDNDTSDSESNVPPEFQAAYDTVKARIIDIQHNNVVPIQSNTPMFGPYVIQVGAFSDAANALRVQKMTQERYSNYQIHNQYDTTAQIYRVYIGSFESKEKADNFLKSIQREFPTDYNKCFVRQIQ